MNEVILKLRNIYLFHNCINKLLSEENKVPRALFEDRKVAGSATYKQSTTVLNCCFPQEQCGLINVPQQIKKYRFIGKKKTVVN